MAWDYISLGTTPYGEKCVQVGSENYLHNATTEANVMIKLMERVNPIPQSLKSFVKYTTKHNSHDYGTYLDVVVKYTDIVQEASDFALLAERLVPEFWDDIAKEELIQKGLLEDIRLPIGKIIKQYLRVIVDDDATYYLGRLYTRYQGLGIDRKRYQGWNDKNVWHINCLVLAYGLTIAEALEDWYKKIKELKDACILKENDTFYTYLTSLEEGMKAITIGH